MGCVGSKEDAADVAKAPPRAEAGNGNGHVDAVKAQAAAAQPAPAAAPAPALLVEAPPPAPPAAQAAPAVPTPQPLYNGPDQGLPAPRQAPPPAPQGAAPPPHHGPPRRERSELKKRQGTEYEEDSDWDQCSTANFNVDEDAQAKDCEVPAVGASVMEKALHNSLFAQEKHVPGPDNVYKETTTLRIDKVKGCMFVNQYLVVRFLGRGACGKVFLCLNTYDLRLYAMKAVRKVDLESSQPPQQGAKKRNPMEDLKREIMIMKKMKHTNIVTLSEVIDDPAGSKLLLVMEYMEGGPVLTREALEKRERLPESLALQYFRDMIKALDYLHGNKVVHGDLKPENVLMAASGEVKLSDFGCSKVFATGNEYLERCNGTPAFLAPEMMKPNTRYRGRPTDVYALGACLYTLLFGRIPFSAPNLYKLFQVVQNEPVKYPPDVPITEELKDLLARMLTKNPRERIGMSELMRHPWLTMNNRFPLKPYRELREGESQEMHNGVMGGLTFAEANPKPDFLTGLANVSRHERVFQEGDIIMRQGDQGTYLLYVVSGTVDILVKWVTMPRRTNSAQVAQGQQGVPGAKPAAKPGAGVDEMMEDSDTMSPIVDEESRQHRVNLMRASQKAGEFVRSLQANAGTTRDLLIAQRGPGELVGEMALFSKSLLRTATVRCATKVVTRVITHEQLVEYVMANPLAKHQVREVILKKESEITMVEALVKLTNVQDVITASLEQAPQF
ncbi:hypothetical protein CHLRE_10g428650v5 [Chlamydomonas reinhardtii]|uniref:Uncharacterized protein n=1 Tax=Chlamydomonas reinhardtii TaxID=3055 RepID=A0A2K3D9N8_CHLRE|nr:uncharacterized protein CHLRE_10g428650v5 [Chlamydomonas reinhardtii]PNW77250.1 hypothetical protein CHLRE_10g428650v5 [Chlamydomonas reinhardtii]